MPAAGLAAAGVAAAAAGVAAAGLPGWVMRTSSTLLNDKCKKTTVQFDAGGQEELLVWTQKGGGALIKICLLLVVLVYVNLIVLALKL